MRSWVAEPGRAGEEPYAWLGSAFPASLAGLALGGWSFTGLPGMGRPAPGLPQAEAPLAWSDSLVVSMGEGAAWDGFGAGLARAEETRRSRPRHAARSVFTAQSGSFGADDDGLALVRGDSTRWFGAGARAWNRGAVAGLEDGGAHVWTIGAGLSRGRHRVSGGFVQRGEAQATTGGARQDGKGEAGDAEYRYAAGWWDAGLSFERAHDSHLSFGDFLPGSRREAQENRVALDARVRTERGQAAARLEWRESQVVRTGGDAARSRARAVWGALEWRQALGEGRLELTLGAGHHGGVGRTELAPSVVYRFAGGPFDGAVRLERAVVPVWSDLAPGQAPFLQSTWAGGFDVGATARDGSGARASLLMGRTRDRALVARLPLEELWLRAGARADDEPYDFSLLTLVAGWRPSHFGIGAEGFALARDASAIQPVVDPPAGGRTYAEWRFRAFQGDLGVTLRAEVEATGVRESEAPTPRRLPAFASAGVTAAFTLADARITVRMRNLEDRRREQVWLDPATGREALGPGRSYTVAVTLRLFN